MSPMLLFETVYSYRKIVDLYAHLSGFNRTSSSWDWNVKQLSPFSTTLSPTIYIWNGFLCCCCCFFLGLTRYLSIWLRNFSVAHTQWVSECVCVFSFANFWLLRIWKEFKNGANIFHMFSDWNDLKRVRTIYAWHSFYSFLAWSFVSLFPVI